MFKKLVLGGMVAVAAVGAASIWTCTRWWRTWGVREVDSVARLPGDDLIEGAQVTDTRGISIAAAPQAVWPWLVQMGYGRAGWYSYDKLDMRGSSADAIMPEFQDLAVGDTTPTDPSGGFRVRVLEPEQALVLYVDTAMVAARAGAADVGDDGTTPAGLKASGRFLETATPPDFAASWAFILRPEGDGGTRLIERMRFRVSDTTGTSRAMGPLLGFGVFVMAQRQMVGIKERVERQAG